MSPFLLLYPLMLTQYFKHWFQSSTAERDFGTAVRWPSVPPCILALDEELCAALPALLGRADGDFVLAYAQVTRMCSGNEIEWHTDSPHFGDVIITVAFCARPKERSPALGPGPLVL